jgi:fructose-1,6-bisphosphatase/sedoheptulose 1,7-bisphosphatase-like protein
MRRAIASEAMAHAIARVVADTVRAVAPLEGCGRKDLIDLTASAALASSLQVHVDKVCVSLISEGQKDEAPSLTEGMEVGPLRGDADRVGIITDPVECTGQLACSQSSRSRGSLCILAAAPIGSVPKLYGGVRAKKLVLPPGTPPELCLDSRPEEIVNGICAAFDRRPEDVHVYILKRPWNEDAISDFQKAGAVVELIPAGDFTAHIRAAAHVKEHRRRVYVSYGIGGLPEGLLAVPYIKRVGGRIYLLPDPLRHHVDEIRKAGCEEMLGRVYDEQMLITSDDCLLAVGGITKSELVPGVQYDDAEQRLCVSIVISSPLFDSVRRFVITFDNKPVAVSTFHRELKGF